MLAFILCATAISTIKVMTTTKTLKGGRRRVYHGISGTLGVGKKIRRRVSIVKRTKTAAAVEFIIVTLAPSHTIDWAKLATR